jgi:hypothetical protein
VCILERQSELPPPSHRLDSAHVRLSACDGLRLRGNLEFGDGCGGFNLIARMSKP